MKSHSRYFFFTIIAALVALVLLVGWIFLIYKSLGIKEEIGSLSGRVAYTRAKEAYLASVRNILRDSKDDVSRIDAQFMPGDAVPQFIDLLEQEAEPYGVKLTFGTINLQSPSDDSTIRPLNIRMSGNGSWQGVVGFISRLETMPSALSVKAVSIARTGRVQAGMADTEKDSWGFNADIIQYATN